MKFTIVGTGYVGLSLSVLISQKYDVTAVDINETIVDLINNKQSPISDSYISEFLSTKILRLKASLPEPGMYRDSDIVIISTPTSYDPDTNQFDTSSVEMILTNVYKENSEALVIIKSTVPVGFTNRMIEEFKGLSIVFSPEFLREGNALYDNLNPSRIIVGFSKHPLTEKFGSILKSLALNDPEILIMESIEAEAVKLFSNTYLAMRVSFFNELDTFSEVKGLNTYNIVKGVSLDPRIGDFYNNPSFGYGGYCLPKDTKQLLYNFNDVPQNLIEAIVKSNETRKQHISDVILETGSKVVGIYRLTMKTGSDNFRDSAIFDVITKLKDNNIEVIVYEPNLQEYKGLELSNDLEYFLETSDLIIANRIDSILNPVHDKVYSRDLFMRD